MIFSNGIINIQHKKTISKAKQNKYRVSLIDNIVFLEFSEKRTCYNPYATDRSNNQAMAPKPTKRKTQQPPQEEQPSGKKRKTNTQPETDILPQDDAPPKYKVHDMILKDTPVQITHVTGADNGRFHIPHRRLLSDTFQRILDLHDAKIPDEAKTPEDERIMEDTPRFISRFVTETKGTMDIMTEDFHALVIHYLTKDAVQDWLILLDEFDTKIQAVIESYDRKERKKYIKPARYYMLCVRFFIAGFLMKDNDWPEIPATWSSGVHGETKVMENLEGACRQILIALFLKAITNGRSDGKYSTEWGYRTILVYFEAVRYQIASVMDCEDFLHRSKQKSEAYLNELGNESYALITWTQLLNYATCMGHLIQLLKGSGTTMQDYWNHVDNHPTEFVHHIDYYGRDVGRLPFCLQYHAYTLLDLPDEHCQLPCITNMTKHISKESYLNKKKKKKDTQADDASHEEQSEDE
jgi:hypothetical protein